jgi:hypothetical protein
MAVGVFSCESGLDPRAFNPAGPYRGLGQQLDDPGNNGVSAWDHRAASFGYRGFSPYNARANADVSIRMARADGTWAEDWPVCGTQASTRAWGRLVERVEGIERLLTASLENGR